MRGFITTVPGHAPHALDQVPLVVAFRDGSKCDMRKLLLSSRAECLTYRDLSSLALTHLCVPQVWDVECEGGPFGLLEMDGRG